MPQVLPSAGQYVGQALAPVIDAVGNMLNPNKRFQESVLDAISKDPTLIQKFADFEAGSPGILKQLGIPALGGVTPTPEAEFAAKMRQQIIGGAEAELEKNTAQSKLDAELIRAAQKVLVNPESPKEARDAALKKLGLGTTDQRTIESEQALAAPAARQLTETRAKVEAAEAPGEIEAAKLKTTGYEVARTMLNDGPDVTLEKFKNNEYTNEQLMALMSTPFKDVIKLQLDREMEQRRINAMYSGDSDALARQREAEAARLFFEVNGAGSKEAAYAYLHEGGQAYASTLVGKDETTLSPQERQLLAIHKALGAARQIEASKVTQQTLSRLTTAVSEFRRIADSKGDNEGQLQLQTQVINGILAEANAPYTAFYGKSGERGITNPFGGSKDIRFKDSSGKVVPLESVAARLTTGEPVATPKVDLTPAQQAEVDKYNALKTDADKQAFIARVRGDLKNDPVALDKFERAIGVKK